MVKERPKRRLGRRAKRMEIVVVPSSRENCLLNWIKTTVPLGKDVAFMVGPDQKRFVVSRALLSISSPEFKRILETDSMGNSVYTFPDVDAKYFYILLEYIYTIRPWKFVNLEESYSLIRVAGRFQMFGLTEEILQYLKGHKLFKRLKKFNETTVIGAFSLFRNYDMKDGSFLKAARSYILQNAAKIFQLEEFLNLTADELKDIISQDDLQVESELQVFKTLLKWTFHELKKNCKPFIVELVQQMLASLLPLVRFPNLQEFEFRLYILPLNILPERQLDWMKKYWRHQRRIEDENPLFSNQSRKYINECTRDQEVGIVFSRDEEDLATFFVLNHKMKVIEHNADVENQTLRQELNLVTEEVKGWNMKLQANIDEFKGALNPVTSNEEDVCEIQPPVTPNNSKRRTPRTPLLPTPAPERFSCARPILRPPVPWRNPESFGFIPPLFPPIWRPSFPLQHPFIPFMRNSFNPPMRRSFTPPIRNEATSPIQKETTPQILNEVTPAIPEPVTTPILSDAEKLMQLRSDKEMLLKETMKFRNTMLCGFAVVIENLSSVRLFQPLKHNAGWVYKSMPNQIPADSVCAFGFHWIWTASNRCFSYQIDTAASTLAVKYLVNEHSNRILIAFCSSNPLNEEALLEELSILENINSATAVVLETDDFSKVTQLVATVSFGNLQASVVIHTGKKALLEIALSDLNK